MTDPRFDRRLLLTVLVIQILSFVLLTALLVGQHRVQKRQGLVLARATEQGARGAELIASLGFEAAHQAYQRAAALAAGVGDLQQSDAYEEGAARAAALALVAAERLPGKSQLAALHELASRLSGAGSPDARAAGAALEVVCLETEGDLPAAAARARRAMQEQKLDSPWLHWQLGVTLLRQHGTADAAAELEQVAHVLPAFGPGLHRFGLAQLAQGKRDAAIASLQQAIEKGAGPDAALDLAKIYLDAQLWNEAIAPLESVLRANPGAVEALRLLGSALYRLKRFDVAAEAYRKAFQLQPEPRTLLSAVIALHGGGAHAQALQLLDTLLPRATEIPEIRYERALLLSDMNRKVDAGGELEAYIKLAEPMAAEQQRVVEAKERLARLTVEN